MVGTNPTRRLLRRAPASARSSDAGSRARNTGLLVVKDVGLAGERAAGNVGREFPDGGHRLVPAFGVSLEEPGRETRIESQKAVEHQHLRVDLASGADPDGRDAGG